MLRPALKFTFRLLSATVALSCAGVAFAQQATLERVKRIGEIKVCVDQDNLPYSSDKMNPPGFDVEVAQEVAKDLGVKISYHWFATNVGKRALRQLVSEGNCDFFLGLPVDENFEENNFKLILSKPYYTGGFATLVRSDAPDTALADNKKKGVGIAMGTLPDFKLFDKGYERKLYRNTAEMYEAVAHKDIDAAVAPAPEAAWMAKSKSDGKLKVLTNTEKEFLFPMGAGVRKADKDLRDVISATFDKLRSSGRLTEIFSKYGMVSLVAEGGGEAPKTDASKDAPKKDGDGPKKDGDGPKKDGAAADPTPAKAAEAPAPAKAAETAPASAKVAEAAVPVAAEVKSDSAATAEKKAEPPKAEAAKPAEHAADSAASHYAPVLPDDQVVDPKKVDDFPSDPKTVDDGRKMYKQACYKCHGPNGVSGGTIPDLRAYAAKNDHYDMFAVIQGGRLEKGMPKWADYLNEAEIKSIVVYVKSLPKK